MEFEPSENDGGDIVNVFPSQLASETASARSSQNVDDPLQDGNEGEGGLENVVGLGDVVVPEEEIEVDADLVRVTKSKRNKIKVFFEGYG